MTTDPQERLDQIKERLDQAIADTKALEEGYGLAEEAYFIDTWSMGPAQADLAKLVAAVEAALDSADPAYDYYPGVHQGVDDYSAGYRHRSFHLRRAIADALGGE